MAKILHDESYTFMLTRIYQPPEDVVHAPELERHGVSFPKATSQGVSIVQHAFCTEIEAMIAITLPLCTKDGNSSLRLYIGEYCSDIQHHRFR